MRRSVAAVVGIAAGILGASAVARRRGALREHVDLYYDDGSMISLTNDSADAERLIPLAREILRATT
ncbi:MAG TPA: hypothetical protein VE269_04070 [Gaiellaceae bacterium]|nr:hypothetical protein [Gaiellaceae bacterium]